MNNTASVLPTEREKELAGSGICCYIVRHGLSLIRIGCGREERNGRQNSVPKTFSLREANIVKRIVPHSSQLQAREKILSA